MTPTILFLCPHGAAKSILAAAYFNRMAQQHGLPYQADAAGTEPDEQVSPKVVAMLREEGIDVSHQQPRRVTNAELENAHVVISMGCELSDLETMPKRLEQWLDIPAVSENAQSANEVIRKHVEEIIASLQGEIP
jgi:arsenate reductase (thioredoxin)